MRPELLGPQAMALGRELLLRRVPLGLLAQLADGSEGLDQLPPSQAMAKLQRLWQDPACQAHPLLAEWWAAARAHLTRPEGLRAWALHVRKVASRAALSAALMAAQLGEKRRGRRVKVAQKAGRKA